MPPQDPQNPALPPQQPSQPLPTTPPQPSPVVSPALEPQTVSPVPPVGQPAPQVSAVPPVSGNTSTDPTPVSASGPLPPPTPISFPQAMPQNPAVVPSVTPVPPVAPISPVPPPPPPAPAAPVSLPPSPGPVVGGQVAASPQAAPQPIITASSYNEGRKASKLLLFIGIGVAALILLTGAFFAVTKLTGGIKLTTYADNNVEILYPKDYEKKDHNTEEFKNEDSGGAGSNVTGVSMSERGGEDIHRSNLGLLVSPASGELKSQVDDIEKNPSTVETFVEDSDVKLSNSKATRFKLNGNDAVKVTSDYTKSADGKKSDGKMHWLVTYNSSNKFAIVMVQADQSDKGLEKSVDKIFNSVKIK